MFHFIFRKKTTIFLLSSIIVISLWFSILLNKKLYEGMDDDGQLTNMTPMDIEKMDNILKNDTLTVLEKIQESMPIIKKIKTLNDINKQGMKSYLNAISEYVSSKPNVDANGKPFDVDAISAEMREKINKLLTSEELMHIEKVIKITTSQSGSPSLIGNDKQLNIIKKEHEKSLSGQLRKYVDSQKEVISGSSTATSTPMSA